MIAVERAPPGFPPKGASAPVRRGGPGDPDTGPSWRGSRPRGVGWGWWTSCGGRVGLGRNSVWFPSGPFQSSSLAARASLAHERPVPVVYPKSSPDAESDGKRPAEVCLESSVLNPVFAKTVIQITKRPLEKQQRDAESTPRRAMGCAWTGS